MLAAAAASTPLPLGLLWSPPGVRVVGHGGWDRGDEFQLVLLLLLLLCCIFEQLSLIAPELSGFPARIASSCPCKGVLLEHRVRRAAPGRRFPRGGGHVSLHGSLHCGQIGLGGLPVGFARSPASSLGRPNCEWVLLEAMLLPLWARWALLLAALRIASCSGSGCHAPHLGRPCKHLS